MAKKWLEKYNDGGPVQPNYNDAKASTGPGYVGTGYDTTGRNYSPAWGGQFQGGGKISAHKPTVKEISQMPDRPIRTDSNLENVLEIVDPTGITSWDDVYRSGRDYGVFSKETAIDALGAIPMLGKLGKVGKVAELASKAFAVTGRQKRNAKAVAETLKAVGKYGPGAARATDAKQAYDERNNEYAMGGGIPGAVGFTYARTAGSAPANGKHTKKTKASAENGKEMSFYQQGLDWKPNNISRDGSVIKDDRGQWAHPGEITQINSNDITMQGVDYPVLGVSDTGDTKMMQPGEDYKFDGKKVTEYPMAQKGITIPTPTTADSLRVYNAALATLNYYKNDKRHIAPKIDEFDPMISRADVNDVGNRNLNQYRQMYKELIDNSENRYTSSLYKKDYKESKQQLLNKVGKAIVEAKSAPPGISYYKDAYPSKIDINAPSAIIDERINPQGFINFKSNVKDAQHSPEPGGNVTGLWYYDPLAVKPYNMRTEEEKIKWNKKYGKEAPKQLVSKPIQKPVSKPTPKPTPKSEPAPVVAQQPTPEKPTPQPKPLYEYEGEQVMAPVPSGGGSAMVGVKKKDGTIEYIKPEDYQRMGVPKYGQDYIKSKQKMQGGGWLEKYK